jgi:peptide methionine sulfoxide reductase MsrA
MNEQEEMDEDEEEEDEDEGEEEREEEDKNNQYDKEIYPADEKQQTPRKFTRKFNGQTKEYILMKIVKSIEELDEFRFKAKKIK